MNADPFFTQTNCTRCGADLRIRTMSKFNSDVICMTCKSDEQKAPGYAEADRAECEAVRAGVRDFPGVGLSPADAEFLASRRALRAKGVAS